MHERPYIEQLCEFDSIEKFNKTYEEIRELARTGKIVINVIDFFEHPDNDDTVCFEKVVRNPEKGLLI